MIVKAMAVGSFEVNTYVLYIAAGGDALVIDPGGESPKILDFLEKNNLSLKYILLTHGHFDHIGAVCDLKYATGAKIIIHKGDEACLKNSNANLSLYSGETIKPSEADILINGGEEIEFLGEKIMCMHTPGHSQGSVCYLCGDKHMFSGDTLFYESVGRSDFPGSSAKLLSESLEKIRKLSKNYTVYPGHGSSTTLAHEKEYNFYLTRLL